MAKGVSVIGSGVCAAQCALTLAELGIEVSVITPLPSLSLDNAADCVSASSVQQLLHLWPLVLRAASHPLVRLYTNSGVKTITGKQGDFEIRAVKQPRYVREEFCTGCGRCEAECLVKVQTQVNGQKISHSAIHAPVLGAKGVPSAYYIDKNGIAPCRASCPLGINVQGFVALLAKGKVDKAMSLITEEVPMPGILGRLCTHPCEVDCVRGKVDSPLYIQALHRFVGDNAPGGIKYTRKAPAGSKKEKIAIIGSGPSGLACAWELARCGYTPTIFESRGVIGGMLATGVPRFRLPREVREREVEAIRALGVDIKTGVTVGRDVIYSDLVERGYKAFFIAIGAQQNKELNIPGEDLNGVSDSMSLLFALNLKVGTTVGSNVVVIGGGNSAADSARAAKRRSKGEVRILCVTEEMTAVKEDVDEAIKEGVIIDYLTAPVEILGDNGKVTGVRCQRVKYAEIEPGGQLKFEPEPGSDFVIEADHVVVSIGQKPNTPELNIKGLEIDISSANIKMDPLTLGTNIPGVFAGGDCVSGSNFLVNAVAAGLRAAESIDRYLKGHDLRKGRSIERLKPVEVDISERKAARYKRAHMPVIPLSKRKGTYEETNLGLPQEVAEREAKRCLSCALCCECLECEQACELGAVNHSDEAEHLEIEAERVINFTKVNGHAHKLNRAGIHNIPVTNNSSLESKLTQASAIALEVAMKLGKKEKERVKSASVGSCVDVKEPITVDEGRIGAVLCTCGGSISSAINFEEVTGEIMRLPGVCSVQEVTQVCTAEGARKIAEFASLEKLGRVVLAACRCCNLEQICFSCTDRRVICQRNFNFDLLHGIPVEFVNIREQCAWVHMDDIKGATQKAIGLISAGINRARESRKAAYEARPVESSVLVLSKGLSGLAAARDLAIQEYRTFLISGLRLDKSRKHQSTEYIENAHKLLKQLEGQGVQNNPWPQAMELRGSPGSFEAVLKFGSRTSQLKAGAIILDLFTLNKKDSSLAKLITTGNFIGRILTRRNSANGLDSLDIRRHTIGETGGVFFVSSNSEMSSEEQVRKGQEAAAKASAYLRQGLFIPRANAVKIEGRLCRGCGDCAVICPFIEIRAGANGIACAYIDAALCYGCGACIASCPTGAITQPLQSEGEMESALKAMLRKLETVSELI